MPEACVAGAMRYVALKVLFASEKRPLYLCIFLLAVGILVITVLILGGHHHAVSSDQWTAAVGGDRNSKGVRHWQGIISLWRSCESSNL